MLLVHQQKPPVLFIEYVVGIVLRTPVFPRRRFRGTLAGILHEVFIILIAFQDLFQRIGIQLFRF